MGRACITNVNDRGFAFLEFLKSMGKVLGYEFGKDAKLCFEFTGELEVSFSNYLEIHPHKTNILRHKAREDMERNSFNKWILIEIIKSLKGGEVVEYIPGDKVRIRDTEKTEIVCIRVSKEEKEKLEKEANELGKTLSELIRSRALS
ncbi:MAG: hypothetical protein QXE63_05610 [Zestosphaera sp.]